MNAFNVLTTLLWKIARNEKIYTLYYIGRFILKMVLGKTLPETLPEAQRTQGIELITLKLLIFFLTDFALILAGEITQMGPLCLVVYQFNIYLTYLFKCSRVNI